MGASKEMFMQEREAQMYETETAFNGVDLEAMNRMTRQEIEHLAWKYGDEKKLSRNNVNAIYWFSKFLYNWLENAEKERQKKYLKSKLHQDELRRQEALKNMDLDSNYLSSKDKRNLLAANK